MATYMIVTAKIEDREAFIQGYGKTTAQLVEKFGGRYVLRGRKMGRRVYGNFRMA